MATKDEQIMELQEKLRVSEQQSIHNFMQLQFKTLNDSMSEIKYILKENKQGLDDVKSTQIEHTDILKAHSEKHELCDSKWELLTPILAALKYPKIAWLFFIGAVWTILKDFSELFKG
jgi:hypothetical protein